MGVAKAQAVLARAAGRPGKRGSLQRPALRYALVAPVVVLLLGMTLYPLGYAVYVSLHTWKLTLPVRPFIGVESFADLLLHDSRFINSLVKTALIGGSALLLEFILGFALALFFWHAFRGNRWLATIVLVPMMISPVVVGFTARMAFTDDYGFVNQILGFVLRRDVTLHWLSDPDLAPLVIIFADVWQWTPFIFLLLLAGLMSVSEELMEAARVDGARAWEVFRYIILPAMRYVVIVAVVLRGLDVIKLFDVILLATRAGPGVATETVNVYIYTLAFRFFDSGYAAAAALLLLVPVSILVFLAVRLLAREPA